MKGWTETEWEYRQRLADEGIAFHERGEARLAVRPARPPSLPGKLVLVRQVGNDSFYRWEDTK